MDVKADNAKPILYLGGSGKGPPTAEDVAALYLALTGRVMTPVEIERARVKFANVANVP